MEGILNFRHEYKMSIDKLKNLLIDNGSKKYACDFINQQIGGYVTINPKTIQHANLNELQFNYNEFNTEYKTHYNVIIIGSGPIGLYMSILLKTLLPDLHIIIIEKNRGQKRKFTRGQILLCKNVISEFNLCFQNIQTILGEDSSKFNFNEKGFNLFPNDLQNYFDNNDVFDNKTDQNAIPINILEIHLSFNAQKLGIDIVNSNDNIVTYISDTTLAIFDATGGRLPYNTPNWNKVGENPLKICKIEFSNERFDVKKTANSAAINTTKYGSYKIECNKCEQTPCSPKLQDEFVFQVKGYNAKDIILINGIPLINIGNTMISVSFTTGDGLRLGFTHSFICALYFKRLFEIHNLRITYSPSAQSIGSTLPQSQTPSQPMVG